MTKFAIERNGSLLIEVCFIGDGNKSLYRKRDIRIMKFETEKKALEVAEALKGKVVNYDEYVAVNKAA